MSARRSRIGVALKWEPLRPGVDHLTGAVTLDERFMGSSEADLAALEWALRLAETWEGEVAAACAGPAGPARCATRSPQAPPAPCGASLRAGHLEVERVDAASKARDGAPARGRPRPYRLRHAGSTRRTAELPACERILKLTGALATRSGR